MLHLAHRVVGTRSGAVDLFQTEVSDSNRGRDSVTRAVLPGELGRPRGASSWKCRLAERVR